MENNKEEIKNKVLLSNAKKCDKIWILHHVCELKNKEIAVLLNTNQGHIGNEIKRYSNSPNLSEKAMKNIE